MPSNEHLCVASGSIIGGLTAWWLINLVGEAFEMSEMLAVTAALAQHNQLATAKNYQPLNGKKEEITTQFVMCGALVGGCVGFAANRLFLGAKNIYQRNIGMIEEMHGEVGATAGNTTPRQ